MKKSLRDWFNNLFHGKKQNLDFNCPKCGTEATYFISNKKAPEIPDNAGEKYPNITERSEPDPDNGVTAVCKQCGHSWRLETVYSKEKRIAEQKKKKKTKYRTADDLEACPMCGETKKLVKHYCDSWFISCRNRDCRWLVEKTGSLEEAKEEWNRRVEEEIDKRQNY